MLFLELSPFANLVIENFIYQNLFQIEDRVFKFHRWIPHPKITDCIFFFLNLDYLPLWSYAPFKGSISEIL